MVRSEVLPGDRDRGLNSPDSCGLISPDVFRRVVGIVTVLLLAEIMFASSGVLGWFGAIALNKGFEFAVSVAALIAWAWSAVRFGGPRRRWRWWMTAAMASFTIGLAGWSWVQVIGATPIPTGSLGPAGFTLTPIIALLALVVRTCGRGTDQRSPLATGRNQVVQALDLVIIGASMLLFAIAALGEPLARRAIIMVANTSAYLLLAAGIVVLARVRPRTRDQQSLLVALSALAYTGSALLFARYYVTMPTNFPPALEAGYLACPTFFFLAALAPSAVDETLPSYPRVTTREAVQLAVPYLPLMGTILFLTAGLIAGVSLTRQQQVILLALMIVVILRQLLTLLENSALLRRAEHEALHDPLTGLANRTLFLHQLEESLASHAGSRRPLVLVFCDMDDFKDVNDTLGHETGDLLLREAASRLQRFVGPDDLVARLGGDEFALLLRDVREPLDELGQRLLGVMQQPHVLGGHPHVASASIGITSLTEDDAPMSIKQFVRSADTAMYAAKKRGKNTLARALEPEQEHA